MEQPGECGHQRPLQPLRWDIPDAECTATPGPQAGGPARGGRAGGQWLRGRVTGPPPAPWPSSAARWGRKSSPPTGAAAHPHSAATVQEEQGVGVASSEGQPGPRAGISLGQQAG